MVLRHGVFSGDIHTTSFAGNFERLVVSPKYLEIKPPVPPEDLVQRYFHEVGAAGKLAERSRTLLQQAIEQERSIGPQLAEEGGKVKALWDEFESFLYGGTQPELAPAANVPAKARPRLENYELRLHKCDTAETDRIAVQEAEAAAAGKPKKKKTIMEKLSGKKTKDEQKAAVEAETKEELEESQGKWTIQGLWPLWASDCPGKKFDVKKLSKIRSELDAKWPSCAESPEEGVDERKNDNAEFWQMEYEKHGRCSELGQNKFFKKGLELFDSYAKDCPKEADQDECRICFDKKMKNKVDCPKIDAEPSFPNLEEAEKKQGMMSSIWDMVSGKKKNSEKEAMVAIAAADDPPTPPWAHDPMASAWVRSKGSLAERAEVAAKRAEGAVILAAGSAEESILTVARAEEKMKSRHGGLRQAWRTGINTVTPQVIGSLEDVQPPEILSPHAGFDHEDGSGLHCREVCHETNAEKELIKEARKDAKACAIQ